MKLKLGVFSFTVEIDDTELLPDGSLQICGHAGNKKGHVTLTRAEMLKINSTKGSVVNPPAGRSSNG